MRRLAAYAVMLALAGCINLPALPTMPVVALTTTAPACPAGQAPMRSDRLYLAAPLPEGEGGRDTWREFVDDVIVPRFPQGLTMWPVQGQWKPPSGSSAHAMSWVIDVVHGPDAESEAAITAVVDAYKRSYPQAPVSRVTSAVCAAF